MAMVEGIVKGVGEVVKEIGETGDKLTTTKEEELEAEIKLKELDQRIAEAQSEIGKIQAASPSLFVAGGRPAIIWIGAIALAWAFILHPVASFILAILKVDVILPEIDYAPLFPLITGILGLGAFRSYDKSKGVDTKAIIARNRIGRMSHKEIKNEAKKWERSSK